MTKAKSGLPTIDEITKPKKTKKDTNMNKVIALTVVATIAVISLFVATFYLGANHQKNYEKTVEARVTQLTKQQAAVKAETSKP